MFTQLECYFGGTFSKVRQGQIGYLQKIVETPDNNSGYCTLSEDDLCYTYIYIYIYYIDCMVC